MAVLGLGKIAEKLKSAKTKERNDAIAELADIDDAVLIRIADDASQFVPILGTVKGLLDGLSIELQAYSPDTAPKDAQLSRIHRLSTLIRRLAGTVLLRSNFRHGKLGTKRYESFIAHICSLTLWSDKVSQKDQMFKPAAYSLMTSLCSLLSMKEYADHLNSSSYSDLVKFVIRCINCMMSPENIENRYSGFPITKITIECFKLLQTILTPDSDGDFIFLCNNSLNPNENYYLRLVLAIERFYTEGYSRGLSSSQSMIHVFNVINILLVSLSKKDFKLGNKLCRLSICFIEDTATVSHDLPELFARFAHICFYYALNAQFEEERLTRDEIFIVIEKLSVAHSDARVYKPLSPNVIKLHSQKNENVLDWYHFKYCSLADDDYKREWNIMTALVKCVVLYFELPPSSSIGDGRKRRKTMASSDRLCEAIRAVDDLTGILHFSLNSTDPKNRMFSLQFVFFIICFASTNSHLSIWMKVTKSIASRLKLKLYMSHLTAPEYQDHKLWAMLFIAISLRSGSTMLTQEDRSGNFQKMLAVCLESVSLKEQDVLSCALASILLQQKDIKYNSVIMDRLELLVADPRSNGPLSINTESLSFMVALHNACRAIRLKSLKSHRSRVSSFIADQLIDWLDSRLPSFLAVRQKIDDIKTLAAFVNWVQGNDKINLENSSHQPVYRPSSEWWIESRQLRVYPYLEVSFALLNNEPWAQWHDSDCKLHAEIIPVDFRSRKLMLDAYWTSHIPADSYNLTVLGVEMAKVSASGELSSYIGAHTSIALEAGDFRTLRDLFYSSESLPSATLFSGVVLDELMSRLSDFSNTVSKGHSVSAVYLESSGELRSMDFDQYVIAYFWRSLDLASFMSYSVKYLRTLQYAPQISKCFEEILRRLTSFSFDKNSWQSWEKLIRDFAETLFGSYDLERTNSTITLSATLVCHMLKSWDMVPEHMKQDLSDICRFLTELHSQNLVLFEDGVASMLALFSSLEGVTENLSENLSEVVQSYIKTLTNSQSSTVYLAASTNPISKISTDHFVTFRSCFTHPEESPESISLFFQCMSKISGISPAVLVLSVFEVIQTLRLSEQHNSRIIASYFMKSISENRVLDSIVEPVMKYWWTSNSSFEGFPYYLFVSEKTLPFPKRYSRMAAALAIAFPTDASLLTLEEAQASEFENTETSLDKIIFAASSLAIAYAFTKGGSRNNVFKFLSLNLSADRYEQVVGQNTVHTVSNILRLSNVNSESSMLLALKRLGIENITSSVLDESSETLAMQDFLSISPNTTVESLKAVITHKYPQAYDFWSPSVVYFLLQQAIMQLESTKMPHMKASVIRICKLIFLLASNSFCSVDVLGLTVRYLAPYLQDEHVHADVSKLITAAIKDGRFPKIILLQVLSFLLLSKASGVTTDMALIAAIQDNTLNMDEKDPLGHIINAALQTLNNRPCLLTVQSICETITLLENETDIDDDNNNGNEKDVENALISILSSLFELQEFTPSIPVIDSKIASWMISHCDSTQSSTFAVWIGKSLGYYCIKNGGVNVDSMVKKYTNDFQTSSSLDSVFRILKNHKAKGGITAEFRFNTMVGYILHEISTAGAAGAAGAQTLNNLDVDRVFPNCQSYIMPIIDFGYLHSDFYESTFIRNNQKSLEELVKEIGTSPVGSHDILDTLLDRIESRTPLAPLLKYHLKKSPELVKHVFSALWIYIISVGGEEERELVITLMNNGINQNFGEHESTLRDLCELALHIRVLSRNEVEQFAGVFSKLDAIKVAELCCKFKDPKAALMLLEDAHFSGFSDWRLDIELLSRVYSLLDEEDLAYGLPVTPNLDYVKRITYEATNDSHRKLLLSNAELNSVFALGENSLKTENVMQSMLDFGFTGMSKVFSEGQDEESQDKDTFYEWAWKLNQWDVQEPVNPTSLDSFTFTFLKGLQCEKPFGPVCKTLVENKKAFAPGLTPSKRLESWLSTLSIGSLSYQYDIDDIRGNFGEHILRSLESISWLHEADFSTAENLLLASRASFEILMNRSMFENRNTLFLAALAATDRLSRLAIANNENQKSLDCSVYMERFIETSQVPHEVKEYARRFSKFNLASAFWGLGDTSFPVEMLKQLSSDDLVPSSFHSPLTELELPRPLLRAYLVKWMSESKHMSSDVIFDQYVDEGTANDFRDVHQRATMYHMFAEFCYNEYQSKVLLDQLKHHEQLRSKRMKEYVDLKLFSENRGNPMEQIRDAVRVSRKTKTQILADEEEILRIKTNRERCFAGAVRFYPIALSLSDEFDYTDVDKFCALWLENGSNSNHDFDPHLQKIPSFKFLSWANQLVSRLLSEINPFQTALENVIARVSLAYPMHMLYLVKSLTMIELHTDDAVAGSRVEAADKLWHKLGLNSSLSTQIEAINQFCQHAMALAKATLEKRSKIPLSSLADGRWWKSGLVNLKLTPPTITLPVENSELPTIVATSEKIAVASSGISLPKILTFTLSTGGTHRILFKSGTDDLRQDSIMEQVFEKVNVLLLKDKETKRRNLRIRTYKVVPLGSVSGVIEFVNNSVALNDILRPLHEKTDELSFGSARKTLKKYQNDTRNKKIMAYDKICELIKPVLSQFFFNKFLTPERWYNSRLVYTHGVASSSIAGYVLGLGDRHNNNILLDQYTGEPIHIDLGVAFDQGKLLPIPETVPFRLTRDIVDGLGITGVKGMFTKSCEHVFRVLKTNDQNIRSILDVLRYDPLYSWTVSPLKLIELQAREDVNVPLPKPQGESEANNAIMGVQAKLDARGLSIEAMVRELISEATDARNLAQIYVGWSPFY
ncbi:unnamed protein product [Kuraishia capsulata CBS 1993]|uniref:Serine/threonine-protein kinase Tel1 n=1 Tax=Kuraishia capsulata CBS 1993 TaxID=1382522 RepID=W6MMN6_9ASCO|nr:uncharacterized protein KUCA_T00003805001 [Kuraishia capsulata CBS 1993]CDK27826.1 unnamed protein product [Kuraishia capsulata CBS 1993]